LRSPECGNLATCRPQEAQSYRRADAEALKNSAVPLSGTGHRNQGWLGCGSMLARRAPWSLIARYFLSITTALAGTAIFFTAFFPGSRGPAVAPDAGSARPGAPAGGSGGSAGGQARAKARARRDRVVLLLVDALRADFIWQNESRFHFVNGKIAEGDALPFTTRAHSPTVTLPRIKSMITGSIPGFLDVKANLDSPALKEDNVISRAVDAGQRVIMFGDETWLKLFPSSFVRSDGTTSFFVLDTKVVDDNVTRHVMPELDNHDWDMMILHYLGLDHAGHLGGTDTEIMRAKQLEMDSIVEQVYTKVRAQEEGDPGARRTIILLCSDHGMNSAGNHGGATEPETDAVAVFFGPQVPVPPQSAPGAALDARLHRPLYSPRAKAGPFPVFWQVDMAATLALLLGVDVPAGNIGRLMPQTLDHLALSEYLDALHANAHQLGSLVIRHRCAGGSAAGPRDDQP